MNWRLPVASHLLVPSVVGALMRSASWPAGAQDEFEEAPYRRFRFHIQVPLHCRGELLDFGLDT